MNEVISALQSAIALNRQTIAYHHHSVESMKCGLDLGSFEVSEYPEDILGYIKSDKNKIAQLVRIQKMLKKQLAKEIRDAHLVTLLSQFDSPLKYLEG